MLQQGPNVGYGLSVLTSCLVRCVPQSFATALTAVPPTTPIVVASAQDEHARYVAGLGWLGLDVVCIAADEDCPDCCFIEDTAVIAGGMAVTTLPGAASRRAEVAPVAAALRQHVAEVVPLTEGTLDGGDCMRLGSTMYVGRSARTNNAGIAALATLLAPRGVTVVAVNLPAGVLHLKCVCSPLDDQRVLLAANTVEPSAFAPAQTVRVPADESYAANVVAVGNKALVPEGFPRTREMLEQLGIQTQAIDNTQLRKADSALTCLSVIVR